MEIKTKSEKLKAKSCGLKNRNKIKPEIRYLNDMKEVLYDKKWLESAPNYELYYMYRGVKKKNGLRYDITVIPPRMLGKEFVKTKGNRNSNNFPELYTVLEGKAILLMQKMKNGIVKDAAAIKMGKGDWAIVSSDYAVIAINPSQKTLKTGNWVSEKNKNIYGELEAMNGAGYFYTKEGWIKNIKYKIAPKLRFEKPLKKSPKSLSFLYG